MVGLQHLQFYLSLLVASYPSSFFNLLDTGFYSLQILQLKFGIDYLLIANRIYRTVNVYNIAVIEATQYVNDSIALTNISQELVAQTFALAGTLYKACNIHNVADSGDNTTRMNQLSQFGESLIGHTNLSQLGVDCTKGEVGCLCLSATQTVEKC